MQVILALLLALAEKLGKTFSQVSQRKGQLNLDYFWDSFEHCSVLKLKISRGHMKVCKSKKKKKRNLNLHAGTPKVLWNIVKH